jgi:hypothetical protein
MNLRAFNTSTTSNQLRSNDAVKLALVVFFALLWAIWIQPHTTALRHILLTIGSLLGLYVMAKNKDLLISKSAVPIYLILALFAWITFHLFFLSSKYELQLEEYQTIWKRILWGFPFAVGLGIVLGQTFKKKDFSDKDLRFEKMLQWIFVIGITAPTCIYLIRFGLMILAARLGWSLPDFAMILSPPSSWHIPKMAYVFFCLPALALACGQIIQLMNKPSQNFYLSMGIYSVIIVAVFAVFYLVNAKNGFAYAGILVFAMLIKIRFDKRSQLNLRKYLIIASAVLAIIFLLAQHVQKNDSWKTLLADIKVAQRINDFDAWKDYGVRGYPVNETGKEVSGGNYLRAAWATVALELIAEKPLGYGLIFKSFGTIALEKWPESTLDTSHSAWLDITLGIGIPGVAIIFLSGLLVLLNVQRVTPSFWRSAAFWLLISISLLMVTTEVARKGYIEALIYLVLWTAGLGLQENKRERRVDHGVKSFSKSE